MKTRRTETREQIVKTETNKKPARHCECKHGNLNHIILSAFVLTLIFISCGGKTTTFVNKQKSDAIDMIVQGNESFREGKYKQSAKYYDRARLIAISIDDLKIRADADINLGQLYLTAKDYKSADSKFNEAKKWSETINYNSGVAASLNGFGVVEMEKGNCNSGKDYFNSALLINPDKFLMAGILSNLGEIERRCGDNESALKYLSEAEGIAKKGKKHMLLSTINYRKSLIYKSNADYEKAIIYANTALEEDKSVEHVYGIFQDLELLSEIYALMNNTKMSDDYNNRAQQVKLLLFGEK